MLRYLDNRTRKESPAGIVRMLGSENQNLIYMTYNATSLKLHILE